jgi:hypothetical protein
LNGLDLSSTTDIPTATAICSTVRGTSWFGIGYSGANAASKFVWNGTAWGIEVATVQPITSFTCY